MKGLKTYFTYLHRNKLFTLVNVAGLGISLMFVLLIANMVVRQLTVGSDIKDIEHIMCCRTRNIAPAITWWVNGWPTVIRKWPTGAR